MKFSEIQMNVATDQAIAGIQKHIPAISLFARSFSSQAGEQFNGVAVPVFANGDGAKVQDAKNPSTDVWGSGEALNGAVITLDKNISKVYALTDYEAASADNLYLADGARAIADQLTMAACKYVFTEVLKDSNLTAVLGDGDALSSYTATAPSDKAGFAGLFATASDAGLNPYDCVLVLNATKFAALMGALDSSVYGGPDAVRNGVIEGLYGFRGVVMSPFLNEGVKGYIIPYNSLGVVSRWDKPAIDGYSDVWTAVDGKTGFTVGYRAYEDLSSGKAFIGGNILFGAKVLQKGIIKLT